MIFDEKCLFFPIKADYYTFFLLFSSKSGNEVQLLTIFDCIKKYMPLDTNKFLF